MKLLIMCLMIFTSSMSFAAEATVKFSGTLHFKSDGSSAPASLILNLKKENQAEAVYAGTVLIQMDQGLVQFKGDFKVKKLKGRIAGSVRHSNESFSFSGDLLPSGLSNLSFRQFVLRNNCETEPGTDGIPDMSCYLDDVQTDSGVFATK